jgi:hypothetical protein
MARYIGSMKSLLSQWKLAVLVIGLGVMAVLIIDFNSRMTEWRRLTQQQEVVGAQATSLMQTQLYLETRIARATLPAGVEEWAYQEGQWVRPGDLLVVPVEVEGSRQLPTPTPVPTRTIISTWQLWLSLFFDQNLP